MRQHYDLYKQKASREQRGLVGDTLAEFIAVELAETYDEAATDEEQLDEAVRVMSRAADDVQAVADALAKVAV